MSEMPAESGVVLTYCLLTDHSAEEAEEEMARASSAAAMQAILAMVSPTVAPPILH